MSPFIECPSKNEFAAKLRTESHENIVDQYLFRGTPFAFRTSHASYDFLVELLANNLGLFADSITMVGSGRIGFTLDPDRFGAPFSVRSDLDVVVVSERMFDEAWFDMLRLGRKCLALEERVRRIVKSHRESYIYWGFVIPDRLPGVVRLSTHWFSNIPSFVALFSVRPLRDQGTTVSHVGICTGPSIELSLPDNGTIAAIACKHGIRGDCHGLQIERANNRMV